MKPLNLLFAMALVTTVAAFPAAADDHNLDDLDVTMEVVDDVGDIDDVVIEMPGPEEDGLSTEDGDAAAAAAAAESSAARAEDERFGRQTDTFEVDKDFDEENENFEFEGDFEEAEEVDEDEFDLPVIEEDPMDEEAPVEDVV